MEKTMRLIHEETIKRISKKNQEGGISTEEAENRKYGDLYEQMEMDLAQMIPDDDAVELEIYLRHVGEISDIIHGYFIDKHQKEDPR